MPRQCLARRIPSEATLRRDACLSHWHTFCWFLVAPRYCQAIEMRDDIRLYRIEMIDHVLYCFIGNGNFLSYEKASEDVDLSRS